jgi:N-acetylmuramoyl-L-alanine amidase-like protein
MRRLLVLILVLGTGYAAPSALAASSAAVTTVDLSARGGKTLAGAESKRRFTLVGLHWRGAGRVVFRTRSLDGTWSSWRRAGPEGEDGPDFGSRERRRGTGWRTGNPWWVGLSDRLEIREVGRVERVRALLVWSPPVGVPMRVPAATEEPGIVPRLSWGASESIRRGPPSYAPAIRFAMVHHTAGRNSYSRAEAAAIVKGIQLYHVQGNGWNDIGYNFLIDRFGTVYEGRYGGVDRNVVGAHARGFNTGSTGVALLGSYGDTAPSRAAQDALTELLAWRLDLAHVDPAGMLTVLSGGSERFVADVPVRLRAVAGHRDTGLTECPGNRLYSRLDALASAAAKLGGPKIFEPRVDASAEGPVRFRARVSTALPWTVVVTSAGSEVARGTGTGTTIDWTWDAASVPPARYAWSVTAGAARPASGSIRAGLGSTALAIVDAAAAPEGITPNGDGQNDTALLTFSLTTPANVTVEVSDAAGAVVATVLDRVWTPVGKQTLTIDGAAFPDGVYSAVVKARTATSAEVLAAVPLTVSRSLGLVSASPAVFSPNGDGRLDLLDIRYVLAAPATVTLRIVRDGRWVATPLVAASLPAGTQSYVWDGSRSEGRLRDGSYFAIVEVTDGIGTVSFGVPFATDTVAPRARILPGRRLRIAVSEPALLRIWINGEPLRRDVKRAGTVLIRWSEPVRRARVVAWDAAGNASLVAVRRQESQKG